MCRFSRDSPGVQSRLEKCAGFYSSRIININSSPMVNYVASNTGGGSKTRVLTFLENTFVLG